MIRVHLLSPESPFHETANLDDASPPPESWVTFPWDSSPWWYESTSWFLSHLSMRQLTLMIRVHLLSPESPFQLTWMIQVHPLSHLCKSPPYSLSPYPARLLYQNSSFWLYFRYFWRNQTVSVKFPADWFNVESTNLKKSFLRYKIKKLEFWWFPCYPWSFHRASQHFKNVLL